jgi:dTDP-4-amino-4,6-dideoxygalactose transaminase
VSFRIYLSPPDVGEEERHRLLAAFDSGWIAPVGPDLDAFEAELADRAGRRYAVALFSGGARFSQGALRGRLADRPASRSLETISRV